MQSQSGIDSGVLALAGHLRREVQCDGMPVVSISPMNTGSSSTCPRIPTSAVPKAVMISSRSQFRCNFPAPRMFGGQDHIHAGEWIAVSYLIGVGATLQRP